MGNLSCVYYEAFSDVIKFVENITESIIARSGGREKRTKGFLFAVVLQTRVDDEDRIIFSLLRFYEKIYTNQFFYNLIEL